jgi:hypothetical protein
MTTWADNTSECIRCGNAPAVDELGYCGHCHWAVKAEVDDGYFRLRQYLTKWARFDDWCSTRDHAALRSS